MKNFKYNLISTKNTKLNKSDEYFNNTLTYGLTLESGYIKFIDNDNKQVVKTTCSNFKHCLSWCNSRVGYFQTRDNVRNARLKKTQMLFENRDLFMAMLEADLNNMILESKIKGLRPYFRLNIASDLAIDIFHDIIEKFSDIKFYDYSKSISKLNILGSYHYHDKLLNYKIAYSISNNELINDYIDTRDNIIVSILPINSKNKDYKLPKFFIKNNGDLLKVVNGDLHDLRAWQDPKNCIVLLKFKGDQKVLNQLIKDNNPYILTKNILDNRFIF